ncbi:MAG: lysophospholipid acyltransferase family protein [Henriciella sp.]|nr:lysophospholipid acyltransferase family protein [Henriciella sp.]
MIRAVLWFLTNIAIRLFGKLKVEGLENVPKTGPVLLAPNHFNFVDPPLILATSPRLVEFIGGNIRPHAPIWTNIFPRLWGIIPAIRGGIALSTLRSSKQVLEQGGVLGIFPEGGNWAEVLRPARPGLAFLSAQNATPVIPITIIGAENLLGWPRTDVTVIYHEPIAAPVINTTGQAKRAEIDAFGEVIMAQIASALPEDQQGKFSASPEARAAAEAVSAFPFEQAHMRGM